MKEATQYIFWLGVILAAIAPFVPQYLAWIAAINFILGLIIGFTNIEAKETQRFLIATIAFLLVYQPFAGALSTMPELAAFTNWLASALMVFGWMIAPAAFIVAAKEIVELAKD